MTHCPYCVRAKQLMDTRGVTYEEIKVADDDDAMWERLEKMSGMKTVPQIWNGDQLVGGYTDLADLDKKDTLQSLKGN